MCDHGANQTIPAISYWEIQMSMAKGPGPLEGNQMLRYIRAPFAFSCHWSKLSGPLGTV